MWDSCVISVMRCETCGAHVCSCVMGVKGVGCKVCYCVESAGVGSDVSKKVISSSMKKNATA